jgi:hypothetical protein
MKLNWGHKIGIAYTAFVIFMLFMVYKTTTVDFDLVVDDYYSEELKFQEQIDRQENLNKAPFKVLVNENLGQLTLNFTGEYSPKDFSGSVMLYKPDNAAFDLVEPLQLDESGSQMVLTPNPGMYRVKLTFSDSQKEYYLEKLVSL